MAAIPEYRFEKPLHAFSKTVLNFAGPFSIKQGQAKQRLKSYILVFTCLQTKAVHLEATLDQSTASVINAFSSFVDMRGLPDEFLSKKLESFTSSTKELENGFKNLDEGLLIRHAYANVNWRFTPPYGEEDLTMNDFRTAINRIIAC